MTVERGEVAESSPRERSSYLMAGRVVGAVATGRRHWPARGSSGFGEMGTSINKSGLVETNLDRYQGWSIVVNSISNKLIEIL